MDSFKDYEVNLKNQAKPANPPRKYAKTEGPWFIWATTEMHTPAVWIRMDSPEGSVTLHLPLHVVGEIMDAARQVYPDKFCRRCRVRVVEDHGRCFMCQELMDELRNDEAREQDTVSE